MRVAREALLVAFSSGFPRSSFRFLFHILDFLLRNVGGTGSLGIVLQKEML